MDLKRLEELNRLRREGALTDAEFEAEKQKLMGDDAAPHAATRPEVPFGLSEGTCMALMNFLILVPSIGWICPIVLWLMGRDASRKVDVQGRYIFNWYLTWVIACFTLGVLALLSVVLCLPATCSLAAFPVAMVVLIIATIALALLFLIFPIIGGIKGLDGQEWKYPLSIPFFSVTR
jgi:uncharacterized protein